jgi:hypothetical protein
MLVNNLGGTPPIELSIAVRWFNLRTDSWLACIGSIHRASFQKSGVIPALMGAGVQWRC